MRIGYQYQYLLRRVMSSGVERQRTLDRCLSLCWETMRLVVSQVAPLISLRRLAYHSAISELLCVLSAAENSFLFKKSPE